MSLKLEEQFRSYGHQRLGQSGASYPINYAQIGTEKKRKQDFMVMSLLFQFCEDRMIGLMLWPIMSRPIRNK